MHFAPLRRRKPETRRLRSGNRPVPASAFVPCYAHGYCSECPKRFFHHLSLPFRIKTIAKIPPPITTATITATIHHGKETLSLSTGEVCSVLFSLFSFRSVLLSLSGSTLLFSSLSPSRLPLYFTGSVFVALQTRQL